MTDGSEGQGKARAAAGTAPEDVPGARPAALDRLEVLVGKWEMEASFGAGYFGPGAPAVTARGGRTTFSWLEGRFFMLQRFVVDQPDAPSGITIIGVAAEPEMFAQHYYDSRGVARVYQMTLADGVWTLWRDEPGFWQRYTATISGDGARIDGAWETSADGTGWKPDFGLTYIRAD